MAWLPSFTATAVEIFSKLACFSFIIDPSPIEIALSYTELIFIKFISKLDPETSNASPPISSNFTFTIFPLQKSQSKASDLEFLNETLYISIPKGVDTDEIITIEDKGNIHNEISGDVKIIIKIKNYTKFERKGLDLIYNKEISLKEALCGFSFDMEYIDGKVFKINNNEGNIISDGYEKNIPNMGMNRDNNIGILTINFKVIYPKKLSLEDIQKIKEIL